jgi:hypothetical protein
LPAALSGSPGERAKLVRGLVENIMADERRIIIKVRRGVLLGGDVPSSASEDPSGSAIELTAAVAFNRRGVETKLVLPGLAQQNHSSRCDPALLKAIARGRARGSRSWPPAAPARSTSWPSVTASPDATSGVWFALPS